MQYAARFNTDETAICPWCLGSGKRNVPRNVNLKCTMRFQPIVKCEACKGTGQVTIAEYRRLMKSASGTFSKA